MHSISLAGEINTPPARFGRAVPQLSTKAVVYRGEASLRSFLYKNGADPQGMRQFLLLNKIGRAFEMESGTQVQIPTPGTFKKHRDSV